MKNNREDFKSLGVMQPQWGILIALALALLLSLTACGDAINTPVSSSGTAVASGVQTAGTAVAGAAQTVGTVVSGGVQTAGTAGAAALTVAPTVISGAVQTAGSAIDQALNPEPTPTVGPPLATPAPTPIVTEDAAGLPVYPFAQPVTFETSQPGQTLDNLNILDTVLNNPSVKFYRVGLTGKPGQIESFYAEELKTRGWLDHSVLPGIQLKMDNLSLFGNQLAFYSKDTQLLLLGISTPLNSATINTLHLTDKFNPGDILVMTAQGESKIKLPQ